MQIPFVVCIPDGERDLNLKDYLIAEELPGILHWGLEGCLEWQQGGLKPPAPVIDATQEYRDEMDLVGQFQDEVLEVDPSEDETKDEVYQVYKKWAEGSGVYPMSKNRFGRKLKDKGIQEGKPRGVHSWLGIRVKHEYRRTLLPYGNHSCS